MLMERHIDTAFPPSMHQKSGRTHGRDGHGRCLYEIAGMTGRRSDVQVRTFA